MFDAINKKSHDYLQQQLDELKNTCDADPAVAEMVRYIIAYSDEMAYSSSGSEDAQIGRQIIQHIWQICGMVFSNIANQFHFNPGWASDLNSFIGNFVYDDAAFDFDIDEDFYDTIKFKPARDDGRWLQNPTVIVEAAKANRAFYEKKNADPRGYREKADISRVLELVK
jgi:hypothetical protein